MSKFGLAVTVLALVAALSDHAYLAATQVLVISIGWAWIRHLSKREEEQ